MKSAVEALHDILKIYHTDLSSWLELADIHLAISDYHVLYPLFRLFYSFIDFFVSFIDN